MALAAGDLDGNADLDTGEDLVVAARGQGQVLLFRNAGGGSFALPPEVLATADGPVSVRVVDVDSDLDRDVVVAAEAEGSLFWLENRDGSGLSWRKWIIDGAAPGVRDVVSALTTTGVTLFAAVSGANEIRRYEPKSNELHCKDGLDNDGDLAIDFPADADCASPLDPTEYPDADGDVVEDSVDNCPYASNSTQFDVGGLGAAPPDGIGDACQCGDTNDSGTVTATDATVLSRAIAGLSPYYSVASGLGGGGAGLSKCNVGAVSPGVAGCTASDATVISRALASLSPGIAQNCDAAQP